MLLSNSVDTRVGLALREANVRPSVLNRPSTTQMLANNSKLLDMLKQGHGNDKIENLPQDTPKFADFLNTRGSATSKADKNSSLTEKSMWGLVNYNRYSIATDSVDGSQGRPHKSVETRKRDTLIQEIQHLAQNGSGEKTKISQLDQFKLKLDSRKSEKTDLLTRSAVMQNNSISSSPSRLARTGFLSRNDVLPTPPKPPSSLLGGRSPLDSQTKHEAVFFRSQATPGSRGSSSEILRDSQPPRPVTTGSGMLSGLKDLQRLYPANSPSALSKSKAAETNAKYLEFESRLFKDSMLSHGKPRASSLQPNKKEPNEDSANSQRGSKASKVLSIIGDLERNRALNFFKSGQKSIVVATVPDTVRASSTFGGSSNSGPLKTGFLNLRRLQKPDLSAQFSTLQSSPIKSMLDPRLDSGATISENKKLFTKDLFKECSGSRFIKTPLNKSSNGAPGKFWVPAGSAVGSQKLVDSSKQKIEAAGGLVFHINDTDFNTTKNENLVVVKRLEQKSKSPSPSPGAARSPMWYVFKYGLEGSQPPPQGVVSTTGGSQISSFTKTLVSKLHQLKK